MRISKHIVPVVLFGTAFAFAYAVAMTRSIPDAAAAADIGGPALSFAAEGDSGAERRTPATGAEIAASRMSESKGPSIPASVRPPGTPVPRGEPLAGLTALEAAAASGQAQAGWKLARMYADGDGVPKNHLRAFEYFRTVADIDAEEPPELPQARYVANAFVALGELLSGGYSRIRTSKPTPPAPARCLRMRRPISGIRRLNISLAACIWRARAAGGSPSRLRGG